MHSDDSSQSSGDIDADFEPIPMPTEWLNLTWESLNPLMEEDSLKRDSDFPSPKTDEARKRRDERKQPDNTKTVSDESDIILEDLEAAFRLELENKRAIAPHPIDVALGILTEWCKAAGVEVASGILPGAGSFLAGAALASIWRPSNTVHIYQESISAIARAIRAEIDAAHIELYEGMVDSARDKLMTYRETEDLSLLNDTLFNLFDTVNVLKRLGVKALGGFVAGANLHLSALIAKYEHNAAYRATYDRKRVEYAGHATEMANLLKASLTRQAEFSVYCDCRASRHHRPGGASRDYEMRMTCRCNDSYFQSTDDSPAAYQKTRNDCEAYRRTIVKETRKKLIKRYVTPLVTGVSYWTSE